MIRKVIQDFLSSKKGIALLVGVIITFVAKYGIDVDEATVTQVVSLVVAYIVGQGIADAGKEAVKIQNGE